MCVQYEMKLSNGRHICLSLIVPHSITEYCAPHWMIQYLNNHKMGSVWTTIFQPIIGIWYNIIWNVRNDDRNSALKFSKNMYGNQFENKMTAFSTQIYWCKSITICINIQMSKNKISILFTFEQENPLRCDALFNVQL